MKHQDNQMTVPVTSDRSLREKVTKILTLLAVLLGLSSAGLAQDEPEQVEVPGAVGIDAPRPEETSAESANGEETEAPLVEVQTARVVEAGRPGHRKVQGVRLLKKDAGRMDWSHQGDWIAFDRPEGEFYHIYVMKPDGAMERCVTCNQWDFRKTNALSPTWHPSGEYIVFTVQEHASKLEMDTLKLTTPHRGLHSELWVIDVKGRQPFRLTQVGERGNALLDPHFSYEADMLTWSQRVVSLGRWGEWEPHVARFQIKRGVPRLSKFKNYQATVRPGFVSAHGFTPSDNGLLISAVPRASRSATGRDIFELDLETGQVENLTSSPQEWDELPVALPRSDGIVWVTDRNIKPPRDRQLPRRGDVWYMSASGRRQERLTFLNHPESDHFLNEALIDDLAWNREGDRLLLHVVLAGAPGADIVEQAIYVVELDGAL